jgi:hypothetical protein
MKGKLPKVEIWLLVVPNDTVKKFDLMIFIQISADLRSINSLKNEQKCLDFEHPIPHLSTYEREIKNIGLPTKCCK